MTDHGAGDNGATVLGTNGHEPAVQSAAQQFVLPEEAVHEDLHRGLKERHVQMIAIGGAIGVGLFLGSAKAIQKRRAVAAADLRRGRSGDLPDHAGAR